MKNIIKIFICIIIALGVSYYLVNNNIFKTDTKSSVYKETEEYLKNEENKDINEIKEKIYGFENTDTDIVITEIGGTVGDIEGLSIVEAIRQVSLEKNPEDVVYIHVTLLPYIFGSNEIKSKPTQHSVKELQSLGIKPDILVCRSELPIDENMKKSIEYGKGIRILNQDLWETIISFIISANNNIPRIKPQKEIAPMEQRS